MLKLAPLRRHCSPCRLESFFPEDIYLVAKVSLFHFLWRQSPRPLKAAHQCLPPVAHHVLVLSDVRQNLPFKAARFRAVHPILITTCGSWPTPSCSIPTCVFSQASSGLGVSLHHPRSQSRYGSRSSQQCNVRCLILSISVEMGNTCRVGRVECGACLLRRYAPFF